MILSREEIIGRIKEVLNEMDGVTLEDTYNQMCSGKEGYKDLSYEGDDVFTEVER